MRRSLGVACLVLYLAASSGLGLAIPAVLYAEAAHVTEDPPEDIPTFYLETWTASALGSLVFVAGSAWTGWRAYLVARERRPGASIGIALGASAAVYYVSSLLALELDPRVAAISLIFSLPGLLFATLAPVAVARWAS